MCKLEANAWKVISRIEGLMATGTLANWLIIVSRYMPFDVVTSFRRMSMISTLPARAALNI